MEKIDRIETPVLILDHYDAMSDMLRRSLRSAGFTGPVVVMEDNGFLPEDTISLYHWFIDDPKQKDGRARFFDQIDLPDYWQITGTNQSGEVWDMEDKRGEILYSNRDPRQQRLVREVRWNDRKGTVRFVDYYDNHGRLYGRMNCDEDGNEFQMSWFDGAGREVITENKKTNDIILNRDGKLMVFRRKTDFAAFFLKEYERVNKIRITDLYYNSLSWPFFVSIERKEERRNGDLLFWQEGPRPDVPGNMQMIFSGQTNTRHVYVQNRKSFERLINAGASKDMTSPLGFAYSYEKKNTHSRDVLICTNSDQVEGLEELAKRFPKLQFHVAAVTEMSQKLLDKGRYANISLYPSVGRKTADSLFLKCDYYLDVNRGGEILDAVRRAFLNDQLILALNSTAHNRKFTAETHIFSDISGLMEYLETVLENGNLDRALKEQKDAAMDEAADTYKKILEKV